MSKILLYIFYAIPLIVVTGGILLGSGRLVYYYPIESGIAITTLLFIWWFIDAITWLFGIDW